MFNHFIFRNQKSVFLPGKKRGFKGPESFFRPALRICAGEGSRRLLQVRSIDSGKNQEIFPFLLEKDGLRNINTYTFYVITISVFTFCVNTFFVLYLLRKRM